MTDYAPLPVALAELQKMEPAPSPKFAAVVAANAGRVAEVARALAPKPAALSRISFDAYKKSEGVNWSSLKHLLKSPAHYRAHGLMKDSDTTSKKLGRAVHLAVLEPEKFAASVVVWDGGTRRGKEWEAFKAANAGREILTEDEHADCLAIAAAVRGDVHAARYLTGGAAEQSVAWTHSVPAVAGFPAWSIGMKGRLDYAVPGLAVVDLKSTRDGSLEGFGREVWKYGYHIQCAIYVDGYAAATGETLPAVILAVESAAPHVVTVYRIPDEVLAIGRETYRDLLSRLHLCRTEDRWPGYSDGEALLTLPRWAAPELSDTEDDAESLGLDIP